MKTSCSDYHYLMLTCRIVEFKGESESMMRSLTKKSIRILAQAGAKNIFWSIPTCAGCWAWSSWGGWRGRRRGCRGRRGPGRSAEISTNTKSSQNFDKVILKGTCFWADWTGELRRSIAQLKVQTLSQFFPCHSGTWSVLKMSSLTWK